jgi:hypothetical protein
MNVRNFIRSTGVIASGIIVVPYLIILPSAYLVGDWFPMIMGQLMAFVMLGFAFVGVPILAHRNRVGFWRGMLGVFAVIAWYAAAFFGAGMLLNAMTGSNEYGVFAFPVTNAAALIFFLVIWWRARRRQQHNDRAIADVFS